MNNSLWGSRILIGRDTEAGKLKVVAKTKEYTKAVVITTQRPVPSSVSRCKGAENTAHCMVEIDDAGVITLTNLKPQNSTYVDGIEIESKHIDESMQIALGKDLYILDLQNVMEQLSKQMPPPAYSIRPLEKVWDEYQRRLDAILQAQDKRNRLQRLPIIIGSTSTLVAFVTNNFSTEISQLLGALDITSLTVIETSYVMVVLLIMSLAVYIYLYFAKDPGVTQRKELSNWLMDNYVCPNPDCRHYMGGQPYKIISQNKKCPHCRCNFTTKPDEGETTAEKQQTDLS